MGDVTDGTWEWDRPTVEVKVMRGGTSSHDRFERQMERLSSRQRLVVLTFADAAEAEAWDQAPDLLAFAALVADDEMGEQP